ncbi:MAG: hypothetical protein KAW12_11835 [Candidatus Aminicenantes bacterium]|nr:hypothetical protein [Candidatus Aminicenantes bacterium]
MPKVIRNPAGLSKITFTLRVYSNLVKDYIEDRSIFRSKGFAGEKALEVYPHLRENILNSLRGIFNIDELNLLVGIINLDKYPPRIVTSVKELVGIIEERKKFIKDISDKIDYNSLVSKIDALDNNQIIVFSEWLITFISFEGKKNFKEYSKRLTNPT